MAIEHPETEFFLGESSINGGLSIAVFGWRVDQPKIEESGGNPLIVSSIILCQY